MIINRTRFTEKPWWNLPGKFIFVQHRGCSWETVPLATLPLFNSKQRRIYKRWIYNVRKKSINRITSFSWVSYYTGCLTRKFMSFKGFCRRLKHLFMLLFTIFWKFLHKSFLSFYNFRCTQPNNKFDQTITKSNLLYLYN